MAVYNLTGAGTIGLTPETSRIVVDVTTFDPNRTIGRATPPNYYDLGLLRFGVQGSFGITQPIDAASMFMDCPDGVTTLGYSLFGTTAIRVTEQFGSAAAGGVHVAGLSFSNTIANDSTTHTLFDYTVPNGHSALVELMSVQCNIAASAATATIQVAFLNQLILDQTVTGPLPVPTTQGWYLVGPLPVQLRMNAGERLNAMFTNQGTSGPIYVIADAVVLQYPQPMW